MKYFFLMLMFQLATSNLDAQLKLKAFPKATYKVTDDFCNKNLSRYAGRKLIKYSISDTIVTISEKCYQPLFFSTGWFPFREKPEHFIRQKDAKVLILHKTLTDSTREELFVDFNANIGDTIRFSNYFWGVCRFTLTRKYYNVNIQDTEYIYRVEHYEPHAIKSKLIPGIVEFTITQDYGVIEFYTNANGKELSTDHFCVTSYYPIITGEGCGN